MTYNKSFWVTAAPVAAAVLIATTVSLGQSLDLQIERIREQRLQSDGPGTRVLGRRRRTSLIRAYLLIIISSLLTMLSLTASLFSLSSKHDFVPPTLTAAALVAAVLTGFIWTLTVADAKLAQAESQR